MCARRQSELSHVEHFMLSAYGSKWREVNLIMFTAYVDDSGTASTQPVASAGILIVPAIQIPQLENDWESFKQEFDFNCFHSSECAAQNYKSEFGKWDGEKVKRAFTKVRRIIKKRTSKAFSFAIHKDDFDAEAPAHWKETGGRNHYTWAMRSVLHQLIRWCNGNSLKAPLEFVFDWAEDNDKLEIEMLMAQFDSTYPGKFIGHYSFRRRCLVPALQCADVLAWSSSAFGRFAFRGTPLLPLAEECILDFITYEDEKWLSALSFTRESLRQTAQMDDPTGKAESERKEWLAKWLESRKPQKKRPPPA